MNVTIFDNMETLRIESTSKTPLIMLNSNGEFNIEGRSIPEDALSFYKPVINWIKEFSKKPSEPVTINIKLDYFNTSSSKCLLDVLKQIEAIKLKSEITFNWFYEKDDEFILEAGQDFVSIIKVPIKANFIEIKKNK